MVKCSDFTKRISRDPASKTIWWVTKSKIVGRAQSHQGRSQHQIRRQIERTLSDLRNQPVRFWITFLRWPIARSNRGNCTE